MGTRRDAKNQMESNPGVPPFMREWAKTVNKSLTNQHAGWITTTTLTTTTTSTTSTTSTSTTSTTTTTT